MRVQEFLSLSSSAQAEFVTGDNPVIEYRSRGTVANGEQREARLIKISQVERDDEALPIYGILRFGGIKKLMPNNGDCIIANQPKIKDKSFKFEWA